ncbi:hypothetical protein COX24_03355 [bacterium (Candidatus Gribaldobacteria) CG23_combo_of_CG06-09_8_20_14_all_37_87_8]|uniref:Glycosyl transferase family 1 domain-containing protein n=1 Tax=bacterium (Candidatus Gribaldobacteria) CG23_combo_of_CG06-09_8_20_14_all_37_87_8 TaxID=2014278 RepID=A0A2G9ZEB1_9BACT|nr:MAG: hypothetical protein COX24_03355 [bacterium (Candidatus Gribaldobacteria) CG23_combo_of_CG06-09_8_20_14_all_37_87_8]
MILLITPFFPPNIGGVEIHLSDYVDFLKKKKIKTIVLTYQPITSKIKAPFREKNGSVEILRFCYPGHNLFYLLEKRPVFQFAYLFFGLFIYSFFYLLLNFKKIEVLHSQGLAAGFVSGVLGKLFRKRTVISLHTIYRFADGANITGFSKIIFSLNNKILAIAKGCKDDLVKVGVDPSKIIVYSYWAKTNYFKPLNRDVCRKKLNLPTDKFISLFIGRFTPEKQLNEALEVAKLSPEIIFLFVGQGPLGEKVKTYANKFSNIKLIGRVENKDLPIYDNAADILLLGSVDENYFGKVTMEAMSCGLPALISDRSYYFGRQKKVDPSVLPSNCGFIVPLDPSKISEKIKKISGNMNELKAFRSSCRRFALSNFSEKNAGIILKTCKA